MILGDDIIIILLTKPLTSQKILFYVDIWTRVFFYSLHDEQYPFLPPRSRGGIRSDAYNEQPLELYPFFRCSYLVEHQFAAF